LQPTSTVPGIEAQQRVTVEASATLAAVGDLLMHYNVKRSAAAANQLNEAGESINSEGFETLFEHMKPLISEADLAFANLETPVAPTNDRGSRSMVFNVSAAVLPALEKTGFDVVSMANNHVYDQGVKGFEETVERLKGSSMEFVGAGDTCAEARAPKVVEVEGIRIGFIASTTLFNDDGNAGEEDVCSFFFDEDKALASVKAAREMGADLVVMSIHWGIEYETQPYKPHVKIAHRLLDGGVDLILGHHAHVLQPVEIRETADGRIGVIVYGMGNFLSNQSAWYRFGVHEDIQGNTRDGVVILLEVVRKNYGKGPDGTEQIRTELANLRAIPTWTVNNGAVMHRTGDPPYIRVHETHALLKAAETALEGETDPEKVLALKKEIELYTVRLRQVESSLGYGLMRAWEGPAPEE